MSDSPCWSCDRRALETVFNAADVPVENSRLARSHGDAVAVAKGQLEIQQCSWCGFIQNSAFDPSLVSYDEDYQDAQGHSPFFREFAGRVIDEMIQTHSLAGARALEIGCGDGDFLRQFCAASGGTGVGLDPALGRRAGQVGAVELRSEAFGPGSGSFDADIVICRHTLEHTPWIADFLTTMREELADRPDVVLYLEIPDSSRIAAESAFWDVYFEHCSYLDEQGFNDLLARAGFEVTRSRLDFGGQYLVAHAAIAAEPIDRRAETMLDFTSLTEEIERWRAWAADLRHQDRRAAVWAASSKAVSFLSAVPDFQPVVAVDINPAKAGSYLPGSGLLICGPDDLRAHEVDTVLVMNPVYLDEIRLDLRRVGVVAELIGLGE